MTNRLPLILVALIAIVTLISWIGDVYGLGMVNLLSADGIRWAVSSVVHNVEGAPVVQIVMAVIAIGATVDSGLVPAIVTRRMSLKQRRALIISSAVLLVCIVSICAMSIFPQSVLRSAFGTLDHSPLSQGIFALSMVTIVVTANFYGFASGRFVNLADTIKGNTAMLAHVSPCFVSLIIAAQLVACVRYTCMFDVIGVGLTIRVIITYTLYILPFVHEIWKYIRR